MSGVETIKRIVPHRFPILLLDRIREIDPDRRLVAVKAVTVNEPCYRSLGDDTPAAGYAYPTSLLVESWAQAAVLLACWGTPNPSVLAGKVELASGLRQVELPAPVLPGQVIEHHVELVRRVDDAAVLAGHSEVDGATVLRVGQFTAALRSADLLRRPVPLGSGR